MYNNDLNLVRRFKDIDKNMENTQEIRLTGTGTVKVNRTIVLENNIIMLQKYKSSGHL